MRQIQCGHQIFPVRSPSVVSEGGCPLAAFYVIHRVASHFCRRFQASLYHKVCLHFLKMCIRAEAVVRLLSMSCAIVRYFPLDFGLAAHHPPFRPALRARVWAQLDFGGGRGVIPKSATHSRIR